MVIIILIIRYKRCRGTKVVAQAQPGTAGRAAGPPPVDRAAAAWPPGCAYQKYCHMHHGYQYSDTLMLGCNSFQ